MSPDKSRSGIDKRWDTTSREILKRRVASLHVRGLRPHEIYQIISEPTRKGEFGPEPSPNYIENPTTKQPYTKRTIYRLIAEIRESWHMEDAERVKAYMADCIGNAEEARRSAWSSGHLTTVLAANHQMARLVGAYKPLEVNINWGALTDEQVERLANGEPLSVVLAGRDSEPGAQGKETAQADDEE